jgi:hypothetical protein
LINPPKDRPRGESADDPSASTQVAERRSAARKPFMAEALVVEVASGARLFGKCCDLVAHGCYLDTLNPFPQGTLVRVRLQHGKEVMDAKGKVVYRVPGLGMGVTFADLSEKAREALGRWLTNQDVEAETFDAMLPFASDEYAPGDRSYSIARLIQILLKKGVLTKAEAASLLEDGLEV